jgi:hypothetical protein
MHKNADINLLNTTKVVKYWILYLQKPIFATIVCEEAKKNTIYTQKNASERRFTDGFSNKNKGA